MTEEMDVEITPTDIDGQLQSVFYQRTFNLGNYENEKIGVVVKALQGQSYDALLGAAMDAVMKDRKEYDDLREKYAKTNHRLLDMQSKVAEMEREVNRLEEEKAKILAYIEGAKVDHPEAVQAIKDAEIKVGDRVALFGVVAAVDPDDKRATYLVDWDNGNQNWVKEKEQLARITGVDAPEKVEASEPDEDDDFDYEDGDEEDEF